MPFDLLTTVEYGGCSAKLSASQLSEILQSLPRVKNPNLLVDIDTHDDAGVYRISSDCALIQTTDFFPPVCSDAADFGRIAAANALSDVYAMGGKVLTAMNIMLFPSNKIPLSVLGDILTGGHEKVTEAGGVIVGGHTIDDYPPKYGLAVTGVVHPEKIITNAAAKAGDILIITKPIGTGIAVSGRRIGEVSDSLYRTVIEGMMQLNKAGSEIMQQYNVRSATDITGFGLLGHALKMAQASGVTFRIDSSKIPVFDGVYKLAEMGCLPGACFRNQEFASPFCKFSNGVDYYRKMILFDAQTSGGLFMAVSSEHARDALEKLRSSGYSQAAIIGEAVQTSDYPIFIS